LYFKVLFNKMFRFNRSYFLLSLLLLLVEIFIGGRMHDVLMRPLQYFGLADKLGFR
jgi:hypothetical protein